MKVPLHGILLFSLVALQPSCTTIRKVNQAPRDDTRFASPVAADIFYQALIRNTTPNNDRDEATVGFFVVSPFRYVRVDGDNVIFNRASKRADTNADGVITEGEAQAYAKRTDRTSSRPAY